MHKVLFFLAIVVGFIVLWKIILGLLSKYKNKIFGKESLKIISKPFLILLILVGVCFGLKGFDIEQDLINIIDSIFYVLIVIQIAYFLTRFVDLLTDWYNKNVALKTETTLDDEFLPLINRVFKIILYIIALVMILSHFGQNISALLTALGVGSLAIALASQEIIANMLAGFIIMIDRPFKIGDKIKLASGEIGCVEQIGLRSTKIRMEENKEILLIVSNSELMRGRIQNFGNSKK